MQLSTHFIFCVLLAISLAQDDHVNGAGDDILPAEEKETEEYENPTITNENSTVQPTEAVEANLTTVITRAAVVEAKTTSTTSTNRTTTTQAKAEPHPQVVEPVKKEENTDKTDSTQKTRVTGDTQKWIPNQSSESHFMSWLLFGAAICVIGYVGMHNKRKILGLLFEGRTGGETRRGRSGARYRRLSQNDEPVIY